MAVANERKWFVLDTNLSTNGMIKSEEEWKEHVKIMKEAGTFEDVKQTRDDDGIGAPFPTFSFRKRMELLLRNFLKRTIWKSIQNKHIE